MGKLTINYQGVSEINKLIEIGVNRVIPLQLDAVPHMQIFRTP